MLFSVDRIEENKAVLIGEDCKQQVVPLEELPYGTKNGDMLRYDGNSFVPAPDKTAERRSHVADMLEKLLRGENE